MKFLLLTFLFNLCFSYAHSAQRWNELSRNQNLVLQESVVAVSAEGTEYKFVEGESFELLSAGHLIHDAFLYEFKAKECSSQKFEADVELYPMADGSYEYGLAVLPGCLFNVYLLGRELGYKSLF